MKKISTIALLCFLTQILFSQDSVQTFTSSGSFVVPEGVTSIFVEVVGEGGSGGFNGSGGGGGGGYASGIYEVTPLEILQVSVGTGESGIATSISGIGISATAGGDGTSVANPELGGGGEGGIGTGGNISNRVGGTGGGGYYTYFGGGGGGAAGSASDGVNGGNTVVWDGANCFTPGGVGGESGGVPGGAGRKGAGFLDNNCSISNDALSGESYGGGGGGGNGIGSAPGTGSGGFASFAWEVISSGINKTTNSNYLQILTNPFTNKIIVKNTIGNESYVLMNEIGKVVWQGKSIEQNDFSAINNGIYVLKVFNEKDLEQVFKLVKV